MARPTIEIKVPFRAPHHPPTKSNPVTDSELVVEMAIPNGHDLQRIKKEVAEGHAGDVLASLFVRGHGFPKKGDEVTDLLDLPAFMVQNIDEEIGYYVSPSSLTLGN